MLSEIVAATDKPTPQAEAITTAPEPEKVEAAVPEGEGVEKDADEGKKVDLRALHEERALRKETQRELRAIREEQQRQAQIQAQREQEWQIGQQRLQQIIQAREAPPPDEQADPLGAGLHIAKQTAAQVEQMRREQWQREQQIAQQNQVMQQRQMQEQAMQQFVNRVTASEAEFKTSHPDYQEALTFAMTRRTKELTAAGYEQDEAAQIAGNDARNLAAQWVGRGLNPAEHAYKMAQAMGYQAVDKEQMHEEGQRASKPSGGGAVKGRMSAQQVAAMTPTQLARLSEEDFRAIMGG